MSEPYKFSFEKLDVWQDSRALTKLIYVVTKSFPDSEKFGLVSQMRRASVSVSSNIAEGSSRTSKKDQAHFYQIAYSSLMELLNQVIISRDLEFLNENHETQIRNSIGKVSNKLNALRKSRINA
jgi:four helix bundle protein